MITQDKGGYGLINRILIASVGKMKTVLHTLKMHVYIKCNRISDAKMMPSRVRYILVFRDSDNSYIRNKPVKTSKNETVCVRHYNYDIIIS